MGNMTLPWRNRNKIVESPRENLLTIQEVHSEKYCCESIPENWFMAKLPGKTYICGEIYGSYMF